MNEKLTADVELELKYSCDHAVWPPSMVFLISAYIAIKVFIIDDIYETVNTPGNRGKQGFCQLNLTYCRVRRSFTRLKMFWRFDYEHR